MTTISPSRKLVTLINVFTVAPANLQQLLNLLARATEDSVRYEPGFISSTLHRGLDGTKVTMYAQWRSIEDYQAMREDPVPLPYLRQALEIARFDSEDALMADSLSVAAVGDEGSPPRRQK